MASRAGTIISTIGISNNLEAAPFVEILERTTLAELMHYISHATEHPLEPLRCLETNQSVVDTNGRVVRYDHRSKQIVDWFGFMFVNTINGLPIILYDNDIITTDKEPQKVENGILHDAITAYTLLERGVEFFVGVVPTIFGEFEVPKLNFGTLDNPDWRLINGQSASGIVRETKPWQPPKDKSIFDLLPDLFGQGNLFGGRLFRIVGLIAGAFIVLIVVLFFVKIVALVMPSKKRG
jgi:hypothetical protein